MLILMRFWKAGGLFWGFRDRQGFLQHDQLSPCAISCEKLKKLPLEFCPVKLSLVSEILAVPLKF